TQKFSGRNETATDKKASNIKNAFYSIQFDYTKVTEVSEDDILKDDNFRYGYLGKFKTYRERTYIDTAGYRKMTGWADTLVMYEPDLSSNPVLANYTIQYYALAPPSHYEPEFLTSDYYDNIH